MPEVRDIVEAIERFAPPAIQADYDNSGLLYGDPDWNVSGVLVTLDTNTDVIEEALQKGCNMIIEHHPTVFYPLKKFDLRLPLHRALCSAIKNDIAIYSAHTSVDFAPGGLNDRFAELLGCVNIRTFDGMSLTGRIGELVPPIPQKEMVRRVARILNADNIDSVGDPDRPVHCVAVINGAGGGKEEALLAARAAGADLFITSELKYHVVRLAKDIGYGIISVGHYESELPFAELISGVLSRAGYGNHVFQAESLKNPYNHRSMQ